MFYFCFWILRKCFVGCSCRHYLFADNVNLHVEIRKSIPFVCQPSLFSILKTVSDIETLNYTKKILPLPTTKHKKDPCAQSRITRKCPIRTAAFQKHTLGMTAICWLPLCCKGGTRQAFALVGPRKALVSFTPGWWKAYELFLLGQQNARQSLSLGLWKALHSLLWAGKKACQSLSLGQQKAWQFISLGLWKALQFLLWACERLFNPLCQDSGWQPLSWHSLTCANLF